MTKYEKYNTDFKEIADKANSAIKFSDVFEHETLYKLNKNRQSACPFCSSGHSGKIGSDGAFTYYPSYNIGKCYSCAKTTNIVELVMHENSFDYVQAIHHIAKKYFSVFLERPEKKVDISNAKRPEQVTVSERKQVTEEELKAEIEKKNKTLNYLIFLALNNNKKEAGDYLRGRAIDIDKLPENAFFQLNAYENNPAGVAFLSSELEFLNKRNYGVFTDKTFSFGTLLNSVYDVCFLPENDTIYVTEGVINSLSIYLCGKSSIALFATTNEISDVEKFRKYFEGKNIIIAFDFDKNFAGQKAAIRRADFIRKNYKTASVSILIHPEGKDDNDLLKDGVLFDFLDNKINYYYLKKNELDKWLTEMQADYKNFQPDISVKNYQSRPALDTEINGDFSKNITELPDEVLEKLRYSDEVSQMMFHTSNFLYVSEYSIVSNRFVHTYTSSFENPIFTVNDKIIIRPFATKPFNKIEFYCDKKENWSYGLNELEVAYLGKEPEEEEKKKEKTKLKRAILVFNFVDFINLYSIDECPIYLHSDIDNELKEKILEFVYEIVITPTSSKNDRKRASVITDKYIRIKTYLTTSSVSDVLKTTSSEHFKKHIGNTALPLQFWKWDKKTADFKINSIILMHFLHRNGYFTYPSLFDKEGFKFIRLNGKLIEEYEYDTFSRHIKTFIDNYLQNKGESLDLRDRVNNSQKISENRLSGLASREDLHQITGDKDFQTWYFADGFLWHVKQTGIERISQNSTTGYIWQNQLLNFPSDLKNKPFTIFEKKAYVDLKTKIATAGTKELKEAAIAEISKLRAIDKYDIEIHDRHNYMLQLLFVMSYVYFERCEKFGYFVKPSDFWYHLPENILTEDEISEIKLHLINKITALGYLMRDYKKRSDDFGVAILDVIDDEETTGGKQRGASGGGKSMLTQAISEVKSTLIIKAEAEDFTKNQFVYARYRNERIVVWEDLHKLAKVGDRLNDFTLGINVNRKHKDDISIPFDKSPKIVITRNFQDNEGERVDRRLARMFVYPFFHDAKSGIFTKSRKPADFFGRQLFTEDTQEHKSDLISFFANAYIATNDVGVINPPLNNMYKHRIINRIGVPLMVFVDNYFFVSDDTYESPFGYIDRIPFYNKFIEDQRLNFSQFQKNKQYSSTSFKNLVAEYCQIRGYVFNPQSIITDEKNLRITRKSESQKDEKGYPRTTEHFYINTEHGFKTGNHNLKENIELPQPEGLPEPLQKKAPF